MKQVSRLIKAIGGKHHNPLEGTHHKWLGTARQSKIRIFLWLFERTCEYDCAKYSAEFGTRSPYARDKRGKALTLSHMAADFGIDPHNLRKDWEEGVAEGIWRNGDENEGENRLYLCGQVEVAPKKRPETPENGVCTYPWEKLPSYISNHIQTLPAERIAEFWGRYRVSEQVEKTLQAEAVAAVREVMEQEHDTIFRDFGKEKIRQEHAANGADPKYLEARAKRVSELSKALGGYVHTLREYVQSAPEALDKPSYTPQNGDVSLLPSELQKEQNSRASESSETVVSRPRQSAPSQQGQKRGQVHAEAAPVLHEEEKQAEFRIFLEFRKMQEHYPRTKFALRPIDQTAKTDQLLVHRVLHAVGAANAPDFLEKVWDKFKPQKGAMGLRKSRAPGEPGGPDSFGLVLTWAKEYGVKLDEAARAGAAEKARVRACEIEAIQALLNDPRYETSDADKAQYRAMLRAYAQQAEGASA